LGSKYLPHSDLFDEHDVMDSDEGMYLSILHFDGVPDIATIHSCHSIDSVRGFIAYR